MVPLRSVSRPSSVSGPFLRLLASCRWHRRWEGARLHRRGAAAQLETIDEAAPDVGPHTGQRPTDGCGRGRCAGTFAVWHVCACAWLLGLCLCMRMRECGRGWPGRGRRGRNRGWSCICPGRCGTSRAWANVTQQRDGGGTGDAVRRGQPRALSGSERSLELN